MSTYTISSGVTSEGITLNDDTMYVLNGGTVIDTIVDRAGFLDVKGLASSTTVKNGGYAQASGGNGVITGMDVQSGGSAFLYYASANDVTIQGGGQLQVHWGAAANDLTMFRDGVLIGWDGQIKFRLDSGVDMSWTVIA